MKVLLRACLFLGALTAFAQTAMSDPTVPRFLSVDINGRNSDTMGPTQAGFQPWDMVGGLLLQPPNIDWSNSGAAGLTKVFATSEGNITANLRGVAPGSNLDARNRGVPGNAYPLSAVLQDFVFAQNSTTPPDPNDPNSPAGGGFGQNFIRLSLSGLIPNQPYQLTMLAREQAFQTADREFDQPNMSAQAYTDMAALGGLDGPGAWLDANVGPKATYQGRFVDDDADPNTPDVDTGYKNPIPTLYRRQITAFDHPGGPYYYSATFRTLANANGEVIVYTWSDANTYGGSNIQRASILNGFEIGLVPEPTSLVLFGISLIGFAGYRRRCL